MQISSANQNPRSDDPVWYFLAEYSLSEFLSDHDPRNEHTVGLLSQTVRELGIPVRGVENIERSLRSFGGKALAYSKQGRVELPGRIRIFCQKKMIGEEMKGGWGYFVIERSRASSTSDCTKPHHFIDLYFYQEGE